MYSALLHLLRNIHPSSSLPSSFLSSYLVVCERTSCRMFPLFSCLVSTGMPLLLQEQSSACKTCLCWINHCGRRTRADVTGVQLQCVYSWHLCTMWAEDFTLVHPCRNHFWPLNCHCPYFPSLSGSIPHLHLIGCLVIEYFCHTLALFSFPLCSLSLRCSSPFHLLSCDEWDWACCKAAGTESNQPVIPWGNKGH